MLIFPAVVWAGTSQTFAQAKSDEVIRVDTTLVQTDVMVFNKQGGFVDGLRSDQFSLRVDGKPRQIAFFERVVAGSRNEEAQLAAARGKGVGGASAKSSAPVPLDRGRTIFFFVDDLHLSAGSLVQTRNLLLRFINRDMGQNDEAAVTSASGQVGFIQQLTDNRAVLRAAVQRLKFRTYPMPNLERPSMSEYQALLIDNNQSDVLDYFTDEILRQYPGVQRATAEEMVRNRATQILRSAGSVTTNTLASLESLIKTSSQLPGRKVVFLVSDGFFLDQRNSDAHERLRKITSLAAAAGVVIYSIDARGLAVSMQDATTEGNVDPSGRLPRASAGELIASQDGLSALATDTGGRPFFNSNLLSAAVSNGLKESSVYYLLAWRPENNEQRNPKFRRIEVAVAGRPDMVVRFRRGFGEFTSAESAAGWRTKPADRAPRPAGEELRAALRSVYPKNALPVSVSLNFVDLPQRGPTLATSLKISTTSLILEAQGAPPSAVLELAAIILDDKGNVVGSFDKRLTIKATSANVTSTPPEDILYNHYSAIKPGLYQVRAAALNEKQGLSGSAQQWIEIPDLGSKALAMSTLIVGERKAEIESNQTDQDKQKEDASALGQVRLNVDHRFARSSRMRFLTFVYNAALGPADRSATTSPNAMAASSSEAASSPDLAVQVQIFRDNEPVMTTLVHKLQVEDPDLTRVPYAAEVPIEEFQSGRYVLQVTVVDRIAKASTSQRFSFQID